MDTSSLYRAVWRWHFYAGLIVLPVLLWMATTGALYLYKPEVERIAYGGWTQRERSDAPLALGELIASVSAQANGRVTSIERPADPAASWRLGVEGTGGAQTAFVEPATGLVLGTVDAGGIAETIKRLHSLTVAGPIGNTLVEIVAGWAILLCLSGFYLWWPRAGQRALALRGRPSSRRFWRNFHASTGAIVGAVILFLAVTGMPWSEQWGGWLRSGVNAAGLGRPPSPGPSPWEHKAHAAADRVMPWSMQHGGHPMDMAPGDIGPDHILTIAAARGIGPGWTLTLPRAPGDPYLVTPPAGRASDARVLWLAATDGKVLQDVGFARFGAGAQAIEWGIAVHQGQQYGESNRLLMLLGCIGVWLLALSAPILWWKRRRGGRLSAPPRADDPRRTRGVAAIMLAIGALFPLTGATMLAALLGEWGMARLAARRYP